MDLFEKALEWYQGFNEGKREAALELFPKKKLEAALEEYNKKKEKKKLEKREKDLKKKLEKCKKLFPVGTIMWSDDDIDKCPNIIICEPYIGKTEYKVPWGVYSPGYEGEKKTILAKSIRMSTYKNEPVDGDWKHSTIGLEICLDNMNSKSEYVRHNYIINLDEYHKTKEEERNKDIKRLEETIIQEQNVLNKHKEEINELELYDPSGLTQELINEIVKEYA